MILLLAKQKQKWGGKDSTALIFGSLNLTKGRLNSFVKQLQVICKISCTVGENL